MSWRVVDCGGHRGGWGYEPVQLLNLNPVAGSDISPRVWKLALSTSNAAAGSWRIRCGVMGGVEITIAAPSVNGDILDVPGVAISVLWVPIVADATGQLNATCAPLWSFPGEFLAP